MTAEDLTQPDADTNPVRWPAEGSGAADPAAPSPDPRLPRWLWPLALSPALIAVATVPTSVDGEADSKALVLALVLAWTAWQATARGLWRMAPARLGAAGWAAVAFLGVAALATVTADQTLLSVIGAPHRHNGLLAYAQGVALLALIVVALPPRGLAAAAKALAIGAALAVAYWLVQLAGWDPLRLRPLPGLYQSTSMLSSTLGNPNFAGAFVAAALPAALWAAVRPGPRWPVRAAWLATAALLTAGVFGADSTQAPLAAAAGAGGLALAVLVGRNRRAAIAAAALGCVLVGVVALGLAQRGPLWALGAQETFVSRTWDWTAAVSMTADHPVTGVGLARFGGYVRAHRPPGDLINYGWEVFADAAHSVPLDMAAGGGIPLLTAYLAFVALTGRRLVQGMRTLTGERLLLLGAFAGTWAAYQAQSLVSLDVGHLSFLHFLSAGAIIALTARAAEAPAGERPKRSPVHVAAAIVGVIALLPVLWLARQTAANVLAGWAGDYHGIDDTPTALRLSAASLRLFPWEPGQWWSHGGYLEDSGATEAALHAYRESVRRDPRELMHLLSAARLADETGDPDLAAELYRQAVIVEPQAAMVKIRAATLAIDMGRTDHALELLDAALAFDPLDTDAQAMRAELLRRASR